MYPLRDVLEYFDNHIEHRHVAWIVSRLCNLTCYLKFSGLVHNGININNCFVSPKYHSILLLGGWWYTRKENEPIIGTTKDIFSIMSVSSKGSKKSSTLTDLESVKLLGRQLLGEPNCRKLALGNFAPNPYQDSIRYGTLNLIDLKNRIDSDLHNINIKKSIAITHVNEYPINEPKLKELFKDFKIYMSDGLTYDDVYCRLRIKPEV